jgi:hypothetical protein
MDRRTFLRIGTGLAVGGPLLVDAVTTSTTLAADAPGAAATALALIGAVPPDVSKAGILAEDRKFLPAGQRMPVVHIEVPTVRAFATTDRHLVFSFDEMPTQAVFTAWLRSWPGPYTLYWNYKHEIDHAVVNGRYTLAKYKADMAKLTSWAAAAAHPHTVNTQILMCWTFYPNNHAPLKPADYWVNGIGYFMADFDGVGPTSSGAYPTFRAGLAAVPAWAKAHKVGWGVGEFGSHRSSLDPQGAHRAAWMTSMVPKLAAAGATTICLFDSNFGMPKTQVMELTTSAEISAWSALSRATALH